MNPIGRRLSSPVLSSDEASCSASIPTESQNFYGWSSEESIPRYGLSGMNATKIERQWPINEAHMVDSLVENVQSEQATPIFPERVSLSNGNSLNSKNKPLFARCSSSSSSRLPSQNAATLIDLNSVDEMDEDSSSLNYDVPETSSSSKRNPFISFSGQFDQGGSSSNSIQTEHDHVQQDRSQISNSSILWSNPLHNRPALAEYDDLYPHLFDSRVVSRSPNVQTPSPMSGTPWFSLHNSSPFHPTPLQGPISSRNTTHVLSGALDSQLANSSGWYSPIYETDNLSRQDGSHRNMIRHGFEHPMYRSQDPTNWSAGPGYSGMAPYMRTFPSSNGHHAPSFPWYPRPNNGNWQRFSDSPSWALFPPMEAEFRASPLNSMSNPQPTPSLSNSARLRALRRRGPIPMERLYEDNSFFRNQRTSPTDFESTNSFTSEIHHIWSAINRGERGNDEISQAFTALIRGEDLSDEDYLLYDPVYRTMSEIRERHDRHRDMRLDVDNMSYEELLALEERIGNVSTGLSDETILKLMKRKKFASSNVVDTSCSFHEPCCICQEQYVEEEEIGELTCGHGFHFECIKQWLNVKNLCPVCKVNGLAV